MHATSYIGILRKNSLKTQTVSTKKIKIAACLLLVQGGLLETSILLALPFMLVAGIEQSRASSHSQFIVPFFQENLYMMMAISGVYGLLRIIGTIGLLRNRIWGFALSVINCITTITIMIFLLPAGIVDDVLSGTALILLPSAWYGTKPISCNK